MTLKAPAVFHEGARHPNSHHDTDWFDRRADDRRVSGGETIGPSRPVAVSSKRWAMACRLLGVIVSEFATFDDRCHHLAKTNPPSYRQRCSLRTDDLMLIHRKL